MAKKSYNSFSTLSTSQLEPVSGKNQVQNNAGGFVFKLDKWKVLDRFLILGSESPTYYASSRKLTKYNAENIIKCIENDGIKTVNRIVEVSLEGRAPKNDPALFALALCASLGNDKTKSYALECLPSVARIPTHLFHFLDYVQNHRGWGRGLKNAVAKWYTSKKPNDLAYHAVKYQQRDGWSHRDVLRLSHPKSDELNSIFKWIVKGELDSNAPAILHGFEKAKLIRNSKDMVKIINEYGLPWEAVPTEMLAFSEVWKELLKNLPMTAMLRNLGRMAANGTLVPLSDEVNFVVSKLTNKDLIKKARIHPLSVLVALNTYSRGRGLKGNLTWTTTSKIQSALNEMFYLSFDNVEPTNKNILLALDVSGSMTQEIAGMPLTCASASAAMAMVTARVEPNYEIFGFCHDFVSLPINDKMDLNSAYKEVQKRNFGGTDCSLPMLYAMEKNIKVDAFIVYTDSETWHGRVHPFQALNEYRRKTGINAKLIVVGMTATGFSIADPRDPGMLDVVGYSTDVPSLISNFINEN